MLRFFRRSPSVALVLMLALVAGPAAGAVCSHMSAHEAGGAMAHEMAMPAAGERAAMPCHEAPEAPAPMREHGADCLSPCCSTDAPASAPVPMALDAPAPAPLATPAAQPPLASAETAAAPDPAPPPEASLRVHLLLGRFLT